MTSVEARIITKKRVYLFISKLFFIRVLLNARQSSAHFVLVSVWFLTQLC